jgi:hypothetical protein
MHVRSWLFAALLALCFASFQGEAARGAVGCITGFNPTSLQIPASGASAASPATFAVVTATPTCAWQFDGGTLPGWLNFPSPFSGVGPGTISFVSVIPNQSLTARSTVVTFDGQPITITQAGTACVPSFSPPIVDIPANGGAGTVTVTGAGNCSNYSTQVSSGVVLITAGATGSTLPATISFSVAPNTTQGELLHAIYVSTTGTFPLGTPGVSIRQAGPPVTTDAPSGGFVFALHRTPSANQVSPAEPVRITNAEDPQATWTAAGNEPWLTVSPANGAGPGTIRIGIDAAALSVYSNGSYSGRVRILSSAAPQTPRDINVTLRITDALSQTSPPSGFVDIPLNNSTGLNGAFPIGGWAIDDVGIKNIRIYRNPIPMEFKGPIYVGDATRVSGARPDIANAPYPEANRAGWGFMLLSNVLPNEDVNGTRFYGSGTYVLSVVAEDFEGQHSEIGQTRVTIDNATATLPFGTIDTPTQGGSATGTYLNRGWVLSPPGRSIPVDGSTIRLIVDGAMLPNVATYGQPRPDVASYFPPVTYVNASGPGAEFSIDTTQIANGLHTIAWYVTDAQGAPQGIGSRFFSVDNGNATQVSGVESRSAAAVRAMPQANALVWDRKGFGEDQWKLRVAGSRSHELEAARGERVEVAFDTWWLSAGCGPYVGYLLKGDVAGPLPPGASVDGEKGVFSWLPPAEFAGTFDFVLIRHACGGREMRIPLRVVIVDK